MRFASPEAFLLLILVPVYIFIYLKILKSEKGVPLPTLNYVNKKPFSLKTLISKSFIISRLFVLILLIFTLARLQIGTEMTTTSIKGIDIILAVDTSNSMLAEDLTPSNRIEAAKKVISDFIKTQKGNRIGLIVFSGRSFTLSPLTLDYDILLNLLSEVTVDTVKRDGTAIGDAIANSLYRFNYLFKDRNKVIILLTDGENNSGVELSKATEMARLKGVKIYTIGVGRPEGVPFAMKNPVTGALQNVTDSAGNLLKTKINEKDLIKIAGATGGAYFRAIDTDTLHEIYNNINELEKTEILLKKYTVYNEKLFYFLIPALILILIEFILSYTIINPIKI